MVFNHIKQLLTGQKNTMLLTFDPSLIIVELPTSIYKLAEQHASGMLDSNQLAYIGAALAIAPLASDAIIVEIGAYQGNTSVYMARVLKLLGKTTKILCIDPFERFKPDKLNPQGSYQKFLETVRKAGFEDTCLPLISFSAEAAPLVPDRIAVLIIDGSHHYEFVRRDLELYAPKVLPGGVIFMDDYSPQYYPGVVRSADEYFTSGCPFTVLQKTYFLIAQRQPGR
jgi:predicted O-methyltransferase YrrM